MRKYLDKEDEANEDGEDDDSVIFEREGMKYKISVEKGQLLVFSDDDVIDWQVKLFSPSDFNKYVDDKEKKGAKSDDETDDKSSNDEKINLFKKKLIKLNFRK